MLVNASSVSRPRDFYLNLLVYFVVGTTWDKDFRICLVLSSLKVDQIYDKNSEFYVPEEQVSTVKADNIGVGVEKVFLSLGGFCCII